MFIPKLFHATLVNVICSVDDTWYEIIVPIEDNVDIILELEWYQFSTLVCDILAWFFTSAMFYWWLFGHDCLLEIT